MNSKKTIKKILLALLFAIILLAGYAFFTNQGGVQGSVNTSTLSSLIGSGTTGQVPETDVSLANTEILKILGSIKNIELRDDIFTNPIFKELKDAQFSIPKPTKVGRTNPFLPIGFDRLSGSESGVVGGENQGLFDSFINANQPTQAENQNFFDQEGNSASADPTTTQNTNDLVDQLAA